MVTPPTVGKPAEAHAPTLAPRLVRALPWLVLALAAAWVAAQAYQHRHHFVDDAYIGFRHAANLRSGEGAVLNPGERVEGVTNLGWVGLLAALGGFAPLPAVAKGLGLGSLLLTLAAVAFVDRRFSPWERTAAVLIAASVPDLVYFGLAGMETGLAALLAMLFAAFAARRELAPPLVSAGLATGLCALHPEGVLLLPLYAGLRQLGGGRADGRETRALALALGGLALGALALTAVRWWHYGALLPNTFRAKPPLSLGEILGQLGSALAGELVNLPPPFAGVFALGLLVLGWWALRPRSPQGADALAAVTLTGVAFALYARPDWTDMGRYFGPYVPAAALLLAAGTAEALRRVLPRARPAACAATLLVVGFLAVGVLRAERHLHGLALEERPGLVLVSETLHPPARWMADNLPADAVIACRRLGVLSYVTGRRVFDYAYGLTDPVVAAAVRARGGWFESPFAADLGPRWREVAPGYLLEDESRFRDWLGSGERRERFTVHGFEYRVLRRFPIGGSGGGETWVLAARQP